MKKLIITIIIVLLCVSPTIAQNVELCVNELLKVYPNMNTEKAVDECKNTLSNLETPKTPLSSIEDKLFFLDSERKNAILNLTKKDIHKILSLDQAKNIDKIAINSISQLSKLSRSQLINAFENEKLNINDLIIEQENFFNSALEKRSVNNDIIEEERRQYLISKQIYKDLIIKYNDNKEEINSLKESLSNCKNNCDEIKKSLSLLNDKQIKYNMDLIENSLEKIKSKVKIDQNLENSQAKETLIEINAHIDKILEIKENPNTKDINEAWKKIRPAIKRISGLSITARLGEAIIKAKRLEEKLDRVTYSLYEQGIDIGIDSDINRFSHYIYEAQKSYSDARNSYTEAKYSYDSEKQIINGDYHLRQASSHIKNAHTELKIILKSINKDKNALSEFQKSNTELIVTEAAYTAIEQ